MTSLEQQLVTFRIPRGLWRDLEETVIQQDRQFLSEVARQLGLPTQEVLRRCLGNGAAQPVPVLWMQKGPSPCACPWWERHGDGLWRRCPRLRLSSTLPCQVHERCTPCPLARLDSDPHIQALPFMQPVSHEGRVYWYDPTGGSPLFREDGTVETEGSIRFINHQGERVPVWQRVPAETESESESETS